MPTSTTSSSSSSSGSSALPGETAEVYQLRAVLVGISPLIWRRLLVPAQLSIAGLHEILQAAFGWGGEHLHRFVIHGVEHGIGYVGGPWFRHNARTTLLGDLGLRVRERFGYAYDFTAGWEVALRVEQIRPVEPGRVYPRCTGGRRAGPPEQWAGPWDFAERTEPYLVYRAARRAAEILGQVLQIADPDESVELGAWREELAELLPLLGLERFDRRALNQTLAGRATDHATVERRIG